MGKVVKLEAKPGSAVAHCTRLQPRPPARSPLTPELKAFIDRVVVPILVRDYLEGAGQQKQIAESAEGVASFGLMANTPNAEVAR